MLNTIACGAKSIATNKNYRFTFCLLIPVSDSVIVIVFFFGTMSLSTEEWISIITVGC